MPFSSQYTTAKMKLNICLPSRQEWLCQSPFQLVSTTVVFAIQSASTVTLVQTHSTQDRKKCGEDWIRAARMVVSLDTNDFMLTLRDLIVCLVGEYKS